MKKVRYPAVAGFFYPKEKPVLEKTLTTFFLQTKKINFDGRPKILVSPHAGINYSGLVAAWGYRQIKEFNFSKFFLLGASHYAWFNYLALSSADWWLTPLGKVKVNKKIIEKITNEQIILDDYPHLKEHSLEVQLIFLKKIFPQLTVIPIMVSQLSKKLILKAAEKIALLLDDESLLIVSTDLSHYPKAEIAQKVDERTIKAVLIGKRDFFEKEIEKIESLGLAGLETAICGYQVVRLALAIGERLGLKWKKIFYRHSGEISGDRTQVVGYGSLLAVKS